LGSKPKCGAAAFRLPSLAGSVGAIGPLLPFTRLAIAEAQPYQIGHSSMAQHFQGMKVGSADFAAFTECQLCE
jgi:hypothetical protein